MMEPNMEKINGALVIEAQDLRNSLALACNMLSRSDDVISVEMSKMIVSKHLDGLEGIVENKHWTAENGRIKWQLHQTRTE